MYLVSGILTLAYQIVLTLGLFALNIIGKAILFVFAIMYTVCQPIGFVISSESSISSPTETMYPEYDIEENRPLEETISIISLVTIISNEEFITQEIITTIDSPSPQNSLKSLSESSEIKRQVVKSILRERGTLDMVNRSVDILFPETDAR